MGAVGRRPLLVVNGPLGELERGSPGTDAPTVHGLMRFSPRDSPSHEAYPEDVVNPALQSAIEAMSLDERLELVEYIESTVDQSQIEVTEQQKTLIRSRAAEFRADPSIGLTWDELKARVAARRA